MAYTYNVKVFGAEEIEQAFKQAPQIARKELGKALKDSALAIEAQTKPRTPVNFGQLRNSMSASGGAIDGPSFQGNNIRVSYGSNVKYAPFMELGTRPHFPPRDALKNWARYKLGNESLWFLVARKIARSGTKPRYFLRDGYRAAKGHIESFIKLSLGSITKQLAK